MPPWTWLIRSLLCRHRSPSSTLSPQPSIQWRLPQSLKRPYTTALQPSRQDDIYAPPLHPVRQDDAKHLYVPFHGNGRGIVKNQRATPSWRRSKTCKSQVFKIYRSAKRASLEEGTLRNGRWGSRVRAKRRVQIQKRTIQPTARAQARSRPSWSWKASFAPTAISQDPSSETSKVWYFYISKLAANLRNKKSNVTDTSLDLGVRTDVWAKAVINRLDHLDHGLETLSRDDLHHLTYEQAPRQVWSRVALWLLTNDQPRMIQFLLATHSEPYVPTPYIEDSLLYLAMHFESSNDPNASVYMQRLAGSFCKLVERDGKTSLSFYNQFFRLLIAHCSVEQVRRVFTSIKAHKVQTHPYTWLHFATHFATNDDFDQGVEALFEAHAHGANLDQYAFRSCCSTILRRASTQPDGLRVCSHLVTTLVDIGVRLDGPMCDIIMLNAVEAGDLKTAFSVYHSLIERGLHPTAYTFAALLKGCKMSVDDADMLNEIIRDAISNMNVRRDKVVATEILHCLALHHSRVSPQMALSIITEAYASLFDLRPLRKLGLPIPDVSQLPAVPKERMTPTRHAITFMVGASVQHQLLSGAHPRELFPLYERWRDHVDVGDPLLADLATTDHLANVFLAAFIQSPKTLLYAARVVRDMQRPLQPSSGVEQCKPSVQTWSIFVHGFARHGQMKLAEQVLKYMRSKGIEPNLVTWNTLVSGYVRVQDTEGTLSTLRSMEASGMVWDTWTYGGLKALRQKQKLQEEMRTHRLNRSLDFSNELKQGLGQRLMESDDLKGFGDSPADLAEDGSYRPFG